jgi:membrane-associated progesterone receptor component
MPPKPRNLYEDDDNNSNKKNNNLPSMTLTELAQYRDGNKIYIAVDGKIFDVSKNPGSYGKNGSYHVFAGRDATRALAMGSTEEKDVLQKPGDKTGLTTGQLITLDDWLERLEAKYPIVGKLSSSTTTTKYVKSKL